MASAKRVVRYFGGIIVAVEAFVLVAAALLTAEGNREILDKLIPSRFLTPQLLLVYMLAGLLLLKYGGKSDELADMDAIRKAYFVLQNNLTGQIDELSAQLKSIHTADVRIFNANLALDRTLRNQVLSLVAELREIGNRIEITGDRPQEPKAPPGGRVKGWDLVAYRHRLADFEGRQKWKQFWDIYRNDFDERVNGIVNELQHANVASEVLIAFPEHVRSYDELEERELRHDLPFSVTNQLIPELLSAADALTRSQLL